MQYIRRRIINDIMGSQQKQRAIAFALTLKEKTNNSSVIRNYKPYKIYKLTGMAYKTIEKYLDVLVKMGLAEFNGGDLYLKKMSSSSKHRNINIRKFKIDKTKNVYYQIRDLIFLIIQSHKDFIKSLLRLRKNPSKETDFKKVRKFCKRCCKNEYGDYKEFGVSYKVAAKKIGCCVRTCVNVVNDTLRRNWCKKKNNCEIHKMRGVNYREVPGYTFTTRNFGFILRSNTYKLSKFWKLSLNAFAVVCARK